MRAVCSTELVLSVMRTESPITTAGLIVNLKERPLDCGVVAFFMTRNPAPGVTTQSNGLLFGEPDGNEQTLSRFGVELAEIALSGIEHAASTSAESSPAGKNCSPSTFSTSHLMPSMALVLAGEAQRSPLLSPQL